MHCFATTFYNALNNARFITSPRLISVALAARCCDCRKMETARQLSLSTYNVFGINLGLVKYLCHFEIIRRKFWRDGLFKSRD